MQLEKQFEVLHKEWLSSKNPILITDLTGKIFQSNHAFLRMAGLHKTDMSHVLAPELLRGADIASCQECYQRVKAKLLRHPEFIRNFYLPNGEIKRAHVNAEAIYHNDEPIGVAVRLAPLQKRLCGNSDDTRG